MGKPQSIAFDSITDPDADPIPVPPKWEFHPHVELTNLLKLGRRGFGVTDLEIQLESSIPFHDGIAPLTIVPGAAARWWDGPSVPNGLPSPDLPAQVYDFYADIGWSPQLAEWLFVDLKVTPGFYSDLRNTGHGAFRPRGQALAIVAFSEQFQVVAGALFVNRVFAKVVPAGGIRYAPSEDTEFLLVFPVPRVSHRVCTWRETKYKMYLGGEFGGGAWGIRRQDARNDVAEYSDLRLLSGLEAELAGKRRWYAEFGYVFGRRINYASRIPHVSHLSDTLLFRAGFTF
jgi:hypothetical protein